MVGQNGGQRPVRRWCVLVVLVVWSRRLVQGILKQGTQRGRWKSHKEIVVGRLQPWLRNKRAVKAVTPTIIGFIRTELWW